MTWCPLHLQDVSQLTNYYNQFILDTASNKSYAFPNAIYLDAVATGGLIRTGERNESAAAWRPCCGQR